MGNQVRKVRPLWDYIHEVIKDLAALQGWNTKRNDTDLESIIFYERLKDIHGFLIKLRRKIGKFYDKEFESFQVCNIDKGAFPNSFASWIKLWDNYFMRPER